MGVHDELGDQAAAYGLGALTPAERQAFEAHLATCAACTSEVRSFAPISAALSQLVPPAEPARSIRAGVLSAIRPRVVPRSYLNWAAAAASIAILTTLLEGRYSARQRDRIISLESQLRTATLRAESNERLVAELRRGSFELRSAMTVLTAPDLARIDLAGQKAAPSASARAFWSRSRGLVFTASNLPAPPPGRAYQLWVLTKQPAPISAGMLTLDANGRVNVTIDTPADLPAPIAMAVTLEPEGGVPSPTGDKYLVGLAN